MTTKPPSPLRQAIYAALADGRRMGIPEIHAEVSKTMHVSKDTVRSSITNMRRENVLDAESEHLRHFKYFLSEERTIQRRVSADRFKLPLKLRGPVLSPIEWCARQLGAV